MWKYIIVISIIAISIIKYSTAKEKQISNEYQQKYNDLL